MFIFDKTLSVRLILASEEDMKDLKKHIEDKLQDLCNDLIVVEPLLTVRIKDNSFNAPTTSDAKTIMQMRHKK